VEWVVKRIAVANLELLLGFAQVFAKVNPLPF
jgi:hypothetical protein